MTDDEAWAMLEHAHTGVLTSLRRDGGPISLPVWFVALDRRVYRRRPGAHQEVRAHPQRPESVVPGRVRHQLGGAGRRPADRTCRSSRKPVSDSNGMTSALHAKYRALPNAAPGDALGHPRELRDGDGDRSRSCPTSGSCRGTTHDCSLRVRHDPQSYGALARASSGREERRTAIIGGAAVAFARAGYSGTSMADISRSAGVSHLIVYRHFESKEVLYEAVLERAVEGLRVALSAADAVGPHGPSPAVLLQAAPRIRLRSKCCGATRLVSAGSPVGSLAHASSCGTPPRLRSPPTSKPGTCAGRRVPPSPIWSKPCSCGWRTATRSSICVSSPPLMPRCGPASAVGPVPLEVNALFGQVCRR